MNASDAHIESAPCVNRVNESGPFKLSTQFWNLRQPLCHTLCAPEPSVEDSNSGTTLNETGARKPQIGALLCCLICSFCANECLCLLHFC